jgi:hypothetical protein
VLGPLDSEDVLVAKTASRHVLGVMNDIAVHLDYAIAADGGLDQSDIAAFNHELRDTCIAATARICSTFDLLAQRGG